MSWERFEYICRKASVECQNQQSISACLSRVESDRSCAFYGEEIAKNSWQRKLLDQISSMENISEAREALEIYKNLNLSSRFEEPIGFKRVVAYLGYVTLMFYIVVGIYRIKVAPSFLEVFDNFGYPVPGYLVIYQDYFGYLVFSISAMLIGALIISLHIKKLFNYRIVGESSFVLRFLVLRRIRQAYFRVIEILEFPSRHVKDGESLSGDSISYHLDSVRKSNMDVSIELQKLLEIEMRSLTANCEKEMKIISVSVALIIILGILFFLISAYSPIFFLGETV